MSTSTKSLLRDLLHGVAWILFAMAGLSFLVGGRALHEFAGADRMLAELAGIGVAAVSVAFGALVQGIANKLGIPVEH